MKLKKERFKNLVKSRFGNEDNTQNKNLDFDKKTKNEADLLKNRINSQLNRDNKKIEFSELKKQSEEMKLENEKLRNEVEKMERELLSYKTSNSCFGFFDSSVAKLSSLPVVKEGIKGIKFILFTSFLIAFSIIGSFLSTSIFAFNDFFLENSITSTPTKGSFLFNSLDQNIKAATKGIKINNQMSLDYIGISNDKEREKQDFHCDFLKEDSRINNSKEFLGNKRKNPKKLKKECQKSILNCKKEEKERKWQNSIIENKEDHIEFNSNSNTNFHKNQKVLTTNTESYLRHLNHLIRTSIINFYLLDYPFGLFYILKS